MGKASSYAMMINVLHAVRVELTSRLREAPFDSRLKEDIGRAWDHMQDAEAILRDIEILEQAGRL